MQFEETREWQIAADSPDTVTIEQQINIINQEITTAGTSTGIVLLSTSNYSGTVSYYFDVVAKVSSGSGTSTLTYDAGTGSVPSGGSTVSIGDITATSYTRYRSSSFSPSGDQNSYVSSLEGTGISVKAARIVIVQTDNLSITSTESQIEVGYSADVTDTSYTSTSDPKIYYYDSSKFDPAPTAYFEATMMNSNISGVSTSTPVTNCGDAVNVANGGPDWNTASFNCGSNEEKANVTCSGTGSDFLKATSFGFSIEAGSIEGIEVTVEGYSTKAAGGIADDYDIYIVKGDSIRTTSTDHAYITNWSQTETTWTYPETGGATDDWGVLEGWTDTDINDSGFGVAISVYDDGSKTPVAYIDNIQIKVYYTTLGGEATTSVRLWNNTDGAAVSNSEIATTTTSWSRIRSASSISLTNEKEYVVQIQTSDTDATASIASAKIILQQSTTSDYGIDALETVHQYVNRLATDDDSTYTSQEFFNQYSSSSWEGGSFAYYFESTIKTESGTGYSQLYNASDSDAIDDSELSTTSDVYVRARSGDLSSNGDWPTSTEKDLDTQIKNSGSATTSVSNSWLVIQASNLQAKDVTVSASGTQTASMDIPSADNYVGGLFVIKDTIWAQEMLKPLPLQSRAVWTLPTILIILSCIMTLILPRPTIAAVSSMMQEATTNMAQLILMGSAQPMAHPPLLKQSAFQQLLLFVYMLFWMWLTALVVAMIWRLRFPIHQLMLQLIAAQ